MEIDFGKIGIKGQIVIPQEMRKDLGFHSGKKVLIVEGENEIILRPLDKFKMETLDELKEQIIDMKLGEKAMREIREGKGASVGVDEFFKEMEDWIKE